MARTVLDIDDEALDLAQRRLGTTSKVATVNAALRKIANQQAALEFLDYLTETKADLTGEAARGAWRE